MEIYGRLTVVDYRKEGPRPEVFCRCECGKEKWYKLYKLKSGHTASCGCLQKERTANATRKHGASSNPIYNVFKDMRNRCYAKQNSMYKRYGGRGIVIQESWLKDPNEFCKWAELNGYKKGLFIDRKDNNGPYSEANCRFVTRSENNNNRSDTRMFEYHGKVLPLRFWSTELNIPFNRLRAHVNKGRSIEESLKHMKSLTAKPK